MAATPQSLRLAFPEFADPARYPDPMVQYWLDVSAKLVNEERWGDLADTGIMLSTAHYLVLAQRAAAAGAAGGTAQVGLMTSKSVDGVSVSYDVSSVTQQGAGHWNMTTYGLQFKDMARLMGAGPLHIGADAPSNAPMGAWPGVIHPIF